MLTLVTKLHKKIGRMHAMGHTFSGSFCTQISIAMVIWPYDVIQLDFDGDQIRHVGCPGAIFPLNRVCGGREQVISSPDI